MAGNELGRVTHQYWYDHDYFRRSVCGGPIEVWTGKEWRKLP